MTNFDIDLLVRNTQASMRKLFPYIIIFSCLTACTGSRSLNKSELFILTINESIIHDNSSEPACKLHSNQKDNLSAFSVKTDTNETNSVKISENSVSVLKTNESKGHLNKYDYANSFNRNSSFIPKPFSLANEINKTKHKKNIRSSSNSDDGVLGLIYGISSIVFGIGSFFLFMNFYYVAGVLIAWLAIALGVIGLLTSDSWNSDIKSTLGKVTSLIGFLIGVILLCIFDPYVFFDVIVFIIEVFIGA